MRECAFGHVTFAAILLDWRRVLSLVTMGRYEAAMSSLRLPIMLGFAGLLPQIAAMAAILWGGPEWRFLALALSYFYAATILAFLGGIWWGFAAAQPSAPQWLYGVAVVPQLVAFFTAWPWAVGQEWPGPSLVMIALALVATLLVDRRLVRLSIAPSWWMVLRVPLSIGLAALCIIIAAIPHGMPL